VRISRVPIFRSSFQTYIQAFAAQLRARAGWNRFFAAFAFGAVASLAFAPTSIFPLLWVSFPALIFLLQGTVNWKQAFATGWAFAFGCFVFGFYWIAASMFVDIGHFWWAVPLAVAGLPAFLAIYYGIAALLARRFGLTDIAGLLMVALLWFAADYARGHLFTGFPWNLEGYGWTNVLSLLQIASITGIYGLTLLTLVCVFLAAGLAEANRRAWQAVGFSLLALIVIAAWGQVRLANAINEPSAVRLRIVQPNVNQAEKWLPAEREGHFQQLLDLSSMPAKQPLTYIIWPETAATFYLTEDAAHRYAVAAHVPKGGAILTGVIQRALEPDNQIHYYNSLIAVDEKARAVAGYNKFHLVPFGEFVPLRHYLPLQPLVNLGLDFSAGDGPHTLHIRKLPSFSPFICYEAILPGEIVDRADRPDFLLNVTNDGWYGKTAGPYQHFASAKVRAIEEGLPLVRAANTGISGVVDAYGRIKARMGVDIMGYMDADLPPPLPPTFFGRHGEKPLWILFIALAACAIAARARRP